MIKFSGHLDLCGPDFIEGWLCITGIEDFWPTLQIYVGRELLGECVADLYREDLQSAGFGDGRCGFSFALNLREDLDFETTRLRFIDAPLFLVPDEATIIHKSAIQNNPDYRAAAVARPRFS